MDSDSGDFYPDVNALTNYEIARCQQTDPSDRSMSEKERELCNKCGHKYSGFPKKGGRKYRKKSRKSKKSKKSKKNHKRKSTRKRR